MKLTYRTYLLLRHIDEVGIDLRKNNPDNLLVQRKWLAPRRKAIEKSFCEKYSKRYTKDDVFRVFRYAFSKDYLETTNPDDTSDAEAGLRPKSPAGEELIEGWRYFPWYGLLRQLWRDDGSFIKVAFVGVAAFLGGSVATHMAHEVIHWWPF